MLDWWRLRLRRLCEQFGHQHAASREAALQLTPWASGKFDPNLRLPSRTQVLALAESAARRGAILLIMCSSSRWFESDVVWRQALHFGAKSPRCSYVTEGNLGIKAWCRIQDALARS